MNYIHTRTLLIFLAGTVLMPASFAATPELTVVEKNITPTETDRRLESVPKKTGAKKEAGKKEASKKDHSAYLNGFETRRKLWSSLDEPNSVLWQLYMDYCDEAVKDEEHERALALAEAALEHTVKWSDSDPRLLKTLERVNNGCKNHHGMDVPHDKILSVVDSVEQLGFQHDYGRDEPPKLDESVSLGPMIREADLWAVEGKADAALVRYRQVLTALQGETARDGGSIVKLIDRITRLYFREGRYGDAETMVRKELKLRETQALQLHPKDPDRLQLAFLLADLALVYDGQHRYFESEALYSEALEIMSSFFEEDHPDTIVILSALARVHKYMGEFELSDKEYKKAVRLARHQPNLSGPSIAVIMGNYAKLLRKMGRDKQAERLESEAEQRSGKALAHGGPHKS